MVMPIKSGGWRLGNDTATVYECFNPDACVPPDDNRTGSASRRRLTVLSDVTTAGDNLCAPGHTGFLCATCQDNWYGYDDLTLCTECEGNIVLGFVPFIILAIVIIVGLIIYCKYAAVA